MTVSGGAAFDAARPAEISPCAVTLDSDQNIYVSNFTARSIEKIYGD